MNQKTTLKLISARLNMSISTVSRALSNHPDISDATKKRVVEFAEMMEYEPNAFAVNLRTNKSKIFCIMIPEISNFFYHSFIAAIEEEARIYGYSAFILQSANNHETELKNIKFCRQNRIAGLFIASPNFNNNIDEITKLEALDIPVVFFDKVPTEIACNKVCVGDEAAAKIAIQMLVQKNKKNVLAFFGSEQMSITQKRLISFNHIVAETKINSYKYFVDNANNAHNTCKEVLQNNKNIDAIFCMSDEILTGAMRAIQELAIRIPSQLSVVAISNGYIPTLYFPLISYVETSGYKLGKAAYIKMQACLLGNDLKTETIIETQFINGGSIA